MTQSPIGLELTNRALGADKRAPCGLCERSSSLLKPFREEWQSGEFPMSDVQTLIRPDGETLAFKAVKGDGSTVIWIGGFRSDMEGTKALALDAAARKRGWNYVRYDHFAHGVSSGDWKQATIGRWREDAVALIDRLEGPVVPVGSSMGGWVALLATLARPDRVKGVVLVNP